MIGAYVLGSLTLGPIVGLCYFSLVGLIQVLQ